jgi:prepilin-type N-terminal cleavage/methylation domain-containing protein
MKKTFSAKKSAFSLIELSIVLIIIGLLIAGVTGGASLIKSSELRAAISEARGWSTAVNGFYNQFNAFPGDYNNALGSATYATGNANSQINAYTVAANPSGAASSTAQCGASGGGCSYEDNVAWTQLKNAGVLDTNVVSNPAVNATWSVANSATFGTTNPASKIKSAGWVFDYGSSGNQSGQNVVVLTGTVSQPGATNTFVNGSPTTTAAITAADALSIDTKVDDGVANAGRVRGVAPGGTGCYSSASYTTSTTTKACALSYQVDLNS